jgi:hypothetical protein
LSKNEAQQRTEVDWAAQNRQTNVTWEWMRTTPNELDLKKSSSLDGCLNVGFPSPPLTHRSGTATQLQRHGTEGGNEMSDIYIKSTLMYHYVFARIYFQA